MKTKHKIYVVGDSHSQVFQGNSQIGGPEVGDNDINLGEHKMTFKTCHVGPFTAYNLHTKISNIEQVLLGFDKQTDYLFFSFGEIDCRHHLGFQSENKQLPIESIVKECVQRYTDVIKHYQNTGYKVGVWAPIAFHTNEFFYKDGVHLFCVNAARLILDEFNDIL